MFLIKKAVFKPIDCKDSANERNIKIKTQFLILEECDERMTGGGVE